MGMARHSTAQHGMHTRKRTHSPYGDPTIEKTGTLCLVSGVLKNLDTQTSTTNGVVTDHSLKQWGKTMLILPEDCRPPAGGRLVFNMNNGVEKTARVDVLDDGEVEWVAGSRTKKWISITGIVIGRDWKPPCQILDDHVRIRKYAMEICMRTQIRTHAHTCMSAAMHRCMCTCMR